MASIRAKLYSRLLRRALRSGLLPEGVEGLQMVRNGETRGSALSLIMGKPSRVQPLKSAQWTRNGSAMKMPIALCYICMAAAMCWAALIRIAQWSQDCANLPAFAGLLSIIDWPPNTPIPAQLKMPNRLMII